MTPGHGGRGPWLAPGEERAFHDRLMSDAALRDALVAQAHRARAIAIAGLAGQLWRYFTGTGESTRSARKIGSRDGVINYSG
jgi:hypothetical protein